MKKHAFLLPLFFVLILLGAGCTQTGSVEVETDEGTNETQEESTRRRAPRAEGSQEDESVDEEESAQEEEEEQGTSANASSTSTAELEELADEVDSLLGGMDAGESGF